LELTLTVARPYNVFSFIFTGHHHITKERNMKNQKGFTLVELMIVVAIIGILAAIAIPQFAAYRIRGFNSSAMSDVRNLNTSEAAFFADWQTYGVTEQPATIAAAGGGAGGAGAAATIANAAGVPVITITANTIVRALQIPVGNGVTLFGHTEVPAAGLPTSFLAFSKHFQGDTYYAVDSDSTAVYQDNASAVPAKAAGYVMLVADTSVASTPNTDNLVALVGPSTKVYVAK
jgi:prepilin-type N-terminal cleavage/methylation domain-containing protein